MEVLGLSGGGGAQTAFQAFKEVSWAAMSTRMSLNVVVWLVAFYWLISTLGTVDDLVVHNLVWHDLGMEMRR